MITISSDAIGDMIDAMNLTGLADDIADHFFADYQDPGTDTVTMHPNVVGNLHFLLNLLQKIYPHHSLLDVTREFEYLDEDVVFSELKQDLLDTLSLEQDKIKARVKEIFDLLEMYNADNRADYISEMQHQEEMRSYYNWGRFQ